MRAMDFCFERLGRQNNTGWKWLCTWNMFSGVPKNGVGAAQASCLSLHLVCSEPLSYCFDFSHQLHWTVLMFLLFSEVWCYIQSPSAPTSTSWDRVNWLHMSPRSTWGYSLKTALIASGSAQASQAEDTKKETSEPFKVVPIGTLCCFPLLFSCGPLVVTALRQSWISQVHSLILWSHFAAACAWLSGHLR